MKVAAGVAEEQALREAGFGDDEITEWKSDTTRSLNEAGFSLQEVKEYFGQVEPDMEPMKEYISQNLAKHSPSPEASETGKPKKYADGILEALEAGFDMSVTGLIASGEPDMLLPEDAPRAARIASQIATMAGDVPAMVAGAVGGGIAGGAAGSAAPVVGNVAGATVGAGAGAFALPTAIRETLMQHYEKGDIKDFGDFWDRSSAVFLETMKSGVIGGATMGVGGAVGKVAAGAALPVRATAVGMSEVATMVTVGKALEGQVPKSDDFIDAAIAVGFLHAAGAGAGKLRQIYAKTGMKPAEVVKAAETNPVLKQELASSSNEIPASLQQSKPKETTEGGPAFEPRMSERSGVLADAEMPTLKVPPMEAKPEPAPKPVPERAPQEQAVLDRIGVEKADKKAVTFDEAYTRLVDDLHPIKRFTEELAGAKFVPVKDDPYVAARLSRGAYGKADQFLELAPFDFHTFQSKGKSFKSIMEPVKNDLDGFRAYAVSARAVELSRRGVETGVPIAEAQAVVRAGKKKFEKTFNELVEFQNHTLTYLKDSGILSKEAFEKMVEANKSYVPFFRMREEGGRSGPGKGLLVKNPVKAIKGSERQIIDPIESIVKNTYTYITLAERNRVMVNMAKLAETSPEGNAFMKRVKTEMKPIEIKAEEVAKFLEEHGIDSSNAEAFTIFRPKQKDLAENEIAVYRDGKREIYEVNPELANAVRAMDHETAGILTKILSVPARTLRAGAVLSPDFMMRNLVRDQLSAFNLSKHGYIPIADALSGLGSLLKKDEHYQNWLKSGGANAAMVSVDRQYISQNVFKLSKETKLMDKVHNVVRSPVEALRVVSELIENSTRLGEYKKATKGDSSAQAIMAGGMASREVTLDFARVGASTRAMNMITAFWNAHVQGLDRTARAFKEDPAGMMAKVGASVTLPSVLLWYANKDDPRWKAIPRWQKDLFWIVMTDDHVYRIPKPFELGLIFGTLPERTLETFFSESPDAMKGFEESLAHAFTPSYLPTFAVPVVEHFANRSTFTGHNIIPAPMESILPEYQYTEYTSETAKALSKLIRTLPGQDQSGSLGSPMVLENYIRAWSGNLGNYALQLADKAASVAGVTPEAVKPASTLADIPFIKAFVIRHPSASAQQIQDFYDRYKESKTVVDTIRNLARRGEFDAMSKELLLDQNRAKLVQLDDMKEALSKHNQMIQLIHKMPDYSADEKRQLIDGLYLSMIEIAEAGNSMMREVDAALAPKK